MPPSSLMLLGRIAGEYVSITHPSARDWKLFMYENNDVEAKKIISKKNKKKSCRDECI
jgi:hypothetical protein